MEITCCISCISWNGFLADPSCVAVLPHVLVRADVLIAVLLMSVLGAGCRQSATTAASRASGAAHQSHPAASTDL